MNCNQVKSQRLCLIFQKLPYIKFKQYASTYCVSTKYELLLIIMSPLSNYSYFQKLMIFLANALRCNDEGGSSPKRQQRCKYAIFIQSSFHYPLAEWISSKVRFGTWSMFGFAVTCRHTNMLTQYKPRKSDIRKEYKVKMHFTFLDSWYICQMHRF